MRGETFGGAVRRLRLAAGLSLSQLAASTYFGESYISKIENGHKAPTTRFAAACDAVLAADGELVMFAELTGPGDHVAPRTPSSGPDIETVVPVLREEWHQLVAMDNLYGPARTIGQVRAMLERIAMLLRTVSAGRRPGLLPIAAQYAESAAWLCEDLADAAGATRWTLQAMEWALEAGDQQMIAWTLFRRSQQAAAAGDGSAAIGLAQAAMRTADLPAPMLAAATQQIAHGHALGGADLACHRALDQALELAAAPDMHGDARAGHGAFCTTAYLDAQRALCWLRLGEPARSVSSFELALPALPAAYRRDHGLGLARLALARVSSGEVEHGAADAKAALAIATDTRSARTLAEVRLAGRALISHRMLPEVAGFLAALRTARA